MDDKYQPVAGSELKRRRLALGARQQDVAELLGITRTALWRHEQAAAVPYLRAQRYLAALDEIAARHGAVA